MNYNWNNGKFKIEHGISFKSLSGFRLSYPAFQLCVQGIKNVFSRCNIINAKILVRPGMPEHIYMITVPQGKKISGWQSGKPIAGILIVSTSGKIGEIFWQGP